jgi:hypothetical protein
MLSLRAPAERTLKHLQSTGRRERVVRVSVVRSAIAASMLHRDGLMGNTQSGASAVRASNTALAAFKLYTQAFGALDSKAVSRHFHEPAMLVTPKDVIVLPTAAAVEQSYSAIMRDMPSDYVRTDFRNLTERRLGDDIALVAGDGSWKNAANDDIMPFGMTYTLKRSGDAWLIVSAVIHAHGMH